MFQHTYISLKKSRAQESGTIVKSSSPKVGYTVKIGNTASLTNPQNVSKLLTLLQSSCPVQRYRMYQIYCHSPYNESKFSLSFSQKCKNLTSCKQAYSVKLAADLKVFTSKEQSKGAVRALAFVREGGDSHLQQPVDVIGLQNIIKQTTDGCNPTAKVFCKRLYNIIESQLDGEAENSETVDTKTQTSRFLRSGNSRIEFLQQILDQISKSEDVSDAKNMKDFLVQRLDKLAAPLINENEKLPYDLLFECFAENFKTFFGYSSQEISLHSSRHLQRNLARLVNTKNEHYDKCESGMVKGIQTFDEEQFQDFVIFDYPVLTSLIVLLPKMLKSGLLDHNIDYWIANNDLKPGNCKQSSAVEQYNEIDLRVAKAVQSFGFDKRSLEFKSGLDKALNSFAMRRKPVANAEIHATKLFEDALLDLNDSRNKLQILQEKRRILDHNIEATAQEIKQKEEVTKRLFEDMLQFQALHRIAKAAKQAENVASSDEKEQLEAELEANTQKLGSTDSKLLQTLQNTPDPIQKQSSKTQLTASSNFKSDCSGTQGLEANITGLEASNGSTQPTSPPQIKNEKGFAPEEDQQLKEKEMQQERVVKQLDKLKRGMGGVHIQSFVNGNPV